MIVTIINVATCGLGLMLGVYTFVRHLKAFSSRDKTPSVDAWLIAMGIMAWSIALFVNVQDMIELQSLESEEIGLSGAQTMANVLMLIYWVGAILQIQKHCLKIKLRKRKLERAK